MWMRDSKRVALVALSGHHQKRWLFGLCVRRRLTAASLRLRLSDSGNHRAAPALRDGSDFFAGVLDETETVELLRRSMGKANADHYWKRMLVLKPHPMDK